MCMSTLQCSTNKKVIMHADLISVGHLYKHFYLRLFVVLLWLTVGTMYLLPPTLMIIGNSYCILPICTSQSYELCLPYGLVTVFKPNDQQEIQESGLQGNVLQCNVM